MTEEYQLEIKKLDGSRYSLQNAETLEEVREAVLQFVGRVLRRDLDLDLDGCLDDEDNISMKWWIVEGTGRREPTEEEYDDLVSAVGGALVPDRL
jgi:hypothetical protein